MATGGPPRLCGACLCVMSRLIVCVVMMRATPTHAHLINTHTVELQLQRSSYRSYCHTGLHPQLIDDSLCALSLLSRGSVCVELSRARLLSSRESPLTPDCVSLGVSCSCLQRRPRRALARSARPPSRRAARAVARRSARLGMPSRSVGHPPPSRTRQPHSVSVLSSARLRFCSASQSASCSGTPSIWSVVRSGSARAASRSPAARAPAATRALVEVVGPEVLDPAAVVEVERHQRAQLDVIVGGKVGML